ncbi:MAG TPA: sterol desaturase family protein [Kofleriaceae bacterium]
MATLNVLFPLTFLSFIALERLTPGRPQPRIRGWLARGLVFFALGGAVNVAVPIAVSALLGGRGLLCLGGLPLALCALIAFVVGDLVGYWRHRLMHRQPLLWRLHQLHHSAERVDIAGSAYSHPLDLAINAALGVSVSVALGISPLAAGVASYASFAIGTFVHLPIATPRWLGHVINRPESHALHHARGVHAHNYGMLSLWDRLFGTFENPAEFASRAGFWDGASQETGALLLGRDVTRRTARP